MMATPNDVVAVRPWHRHGAKVPTVRRGPYTTSTSTSAAVSSPDARRRAALAADLLRAVELCRVHRSKDADAYLAARNKADHVVALIVRGELEGRW